MNSPPISVVIPCYNCADKILELLTSISVQSYNFFEVILINDGSTDNLISIINTTSFSFKFSIYSQPNKGRSRSRNKGASLATYEYILFLDSDIKIPNNHFEKIVNQIKANPNAIISGPAIEKHNETTEFGEYKSMISSKWNEEVIKPALTSANMVLKKDIFTALNGFDVQLCDAEDFDFKIRAQQNNYSILYYKDLAVEHNSFYTCVEYITRQREYRKAHVELLKIRSNSPAFSEYLEHHPEKSNFKQLVYFFFIPSLPRMIDKGYFKILPQNLRYFFYSRVVAALSVYFPNRDI